MINNILFDLDGTLLPMNMEEFTNGYFKHLVKKAMSASDKYTPDELVKTIWGGVKAMVMNRGDKCNEDAFWEYFASVYGEEALADKKIFDDFYANDFICAKDYTGYNEMAKNAV